MLCWVERNADPAQLTVLQALKPLRDRRSCAAGFDVEVAAWRVWWGGRLAKVFMCSVWAAGHHRLWATSRHKDKTQYLGMMREFNGGCACLS